MNPRYLMNPGWNHLAWMISNVKNVEIKGCSLKPRGNYGNNSTARSLPGLTVQFTPTHRKHAEPLRLNCKVHIAMHASRNR